MRFLPILIISLLPSAAFAQNYSNAPMVIVGQGAPNTQAPASAAPASAASPTSAAAPATASATTTTTVASPAAVTPVPGKGFPNFPENAITRVGENSTGLHVDTPANPPTPATPAAVSAGAAPVTPASPGSPASPPSPVSKLWPRNTVEIFMGPCTGLRPQFFLPCTCVITKLMLAMPHDEFLRESETGTIEQDPRLIRVRTDCATAPKKQDE